MRSFPKWGHFRSQAACSSGAGHWQSLFCSTNHAGTGLLTANLAATAGQTRTVPSGLGLADRGNEQNFIDYTGLVFFFLLLFSFMCFVFLLTPFSSIFPLLLFSASTSLPSLFMFQMMASVRTDVHSNRQCLKPLTSALSQKVQVSSLPKAYQEKAVNRVKTR